MQVLWLLCACTICACTFVLAHEFIKAAIVHERTMAIVHACADETVHAFPIA